MVRIIIYAIGVMILIKTFVWIADRPGTVILEWQGWRLDTTIPIFLFLLFLIIVFIIFLLRLLGLFHALPHRMHSRWNQYRRSKGYAALNAGFAAVAEGDVTNAIKMANDAGNFLKNSHTTLLLQAQAAELAGDEIAVRRYYDLLRVHPTTELIGLKGLITAAYRAGHHSQVLDLAKRAVTVRPVNWAVQSLFEALVRERLWAEAAQTLEKHRDNAFKPPEKARRYQVVLDTQQALEANEPREALRLARRALGRDAGMVPAALLAAQLYTRSGRARKAARLIESAWCRTLHPGLIQTYFDIWPHDDAQRRMQRAERLVAMTSTPEHIENRLLIADAALEAQLWDKARSQLVSLLSAKMLSQRVAVLMARLEQWEYHNTAAAEEWLQRASTAPANATGWHCRICGTATAQWNACCAHCGNFDSLAWINESGQERESLLMQEEIHSSIKSDRKSAPRFGTA